jgi:hypothetical protein
VCSFRTAIKKAGKAVMMSVKRESGHIFDSVKKNSALKSAMRSVRIFLTDLLWYFLTVSSF